MPEKRRSFIKKVSCLASASVLMPAINALAQEKGKKKILLRNCWQTINIGDIAHVFGIMELFIKHIPDVEIILWPVLIDNGVEELIRKTYPHLKIVNGRFDLTKGKPDTEELQKAFDECHLMIYGSGWYYEKSTDLRSWWKTTKKPFGVYGDTVQELNPELQDLFNHASFFYFRDTASLKYVKSLNLKCPVQEFGPDSTFGINLHNDKKAAAYLQSVGLKKGEFICVIPRLRYTPNWKMKGYAPSEEEKWKYEVSLKYKASDAEKLRTIITSWVKETGLKVLACPEVAFQVELAKETIVDPLPEEIKKNVVWRDSFWLTDEAASVYARSRAVVSLEIHSTIIAVAERIPAIHIKHPTDTRKGQMWRDIGLADWLFEMDETPASQIANKILEIHHNYPQALEKLDKTRSYLQQVQKNTMSTIKNVLINN
jgi:polysaccharide pyruvyl transferase WcaK-like protein